MRSLIRELIETVILALLIFLALQFSVQNFRVEGSSMQPNLEEGQYLLVNKIVYFHLAPSGLRSLFSSGPEAQDESVYPIRDPKRGDVIIFHFPRDVSRDFVKRVIGLPGDTVEVSQGEVYVNGLQLEEPYLRDDVKTYLNRREQSKEWVLGAEEFFVLGDNRRASNDSRDWDTVPTENIIGRAWVSYWPLDQMHSLRAFPLPF